MIKSMGCGSDDVSCKPNVDCEWNDCSTICDGLHHHFRYVALQGSGHGKFCTGVADEET